MGMPGGPMPSASRDEKGPSPRRGPPAGRCRRRLPKDPVKVPRSSPLCLSPQCGFSSAVEGNTLTSDQQFARLSLIAETAREVWG
ncbi:hypothetical protein [Nonomuraea sp. NPDC048916]|uniref:hypothetical protein n=1 Tax=Nonomuraea sp. NPDC048916 TaxID=3154232 RepID=UPI00340937DE